MLPKISFFFLTNKIQTVKAPFFLFDQNLAYPQGNPNFDSSDLIQITKRSLFNISQYEHEDLQPILKRDTLDA